MDTLMKFEDYPENRKAIVHKSDAEGGLIIDRLTGHVIQPLMERPEWAEGLTLALLAERHGFYTTRLGPLYTAEMKNPEIFEFADLGWIGTTAEGEAVEIEADAEHRMEVIAKVTGVDRETGAHETGKGWNLAAEVEVAMDQHRTDAEAAALLTSQEQAFDRKTGTE